MERLYVAVQGSTVGRTDERLQIRKDGIVLRDVRTRELQEVLLLGRVQLTSEAAAFLLEREIDVFYLTEHGKYRGRLVGDTGRAVGLRKAQFRAVSDPVVRLLVARRLVAEKIRFQHQLLSRANRRGNEELAQAARELLRIRERVLAGEGETSNDLMGLEGAAAAVYFPAFGRTLTADLGFTGRRRRPPPDPVNALLSFGYAMLQATVGAVARTVGLDPWLGFLHADQDGRDSLVLDLMEPFRPIFVDTAVRTLVNQRAMGIEDFERGPVGTVRLGSKGIAVLVGYYQRRLEQTVTAGPQEQKLEWQQVLELYLRGLVRLLRDGKVTELGSIPVDL